MGYIIATIAAVIILLLVFALLLRKQDENVGQAEDDPSGEKKHGLSYEEPQDEGVPQPLARRRDKDAG